MSDGPIDVTLVRIRAESSAADPDTCRFVLDAPVHGEGSFSYDNAEQAEGSPLPARLFELDGVRFVMISSEVVTVSKTAAATWEALRPAVAGELRAHLRSGMPAVLEDRYDPSTGKRDDATLRTVIERLLEREVNPSIAAHGGRIGLVDLRDATLYIEMSGGCQGCASSRVTLRQGVEVMVRRVAPEIVDIVDTTDHASGANPFYSPKSQG